MAIENVLTIIVGLLSITIPIYILINGKDRQASVVYGILGILAGPFWALALVLFRESTDVKTALFWDRMIYLDAILIAPLFFRFSNTFPKKRNVHILVRLIIIGIGGFLLYQVFFTEHFIREIIITQNGNSITVGYAYYIWLVWFSVLMGFGVLAMVWEYAKLSGTIKNQAKYIVIGAILPAVGTLPTNAVLPIFGIYQYIWIGPFFLIGMNLVVAYGLTRTRFWGETIAIRYLVRPLIVFIFASILCFGGLRLLELHLMQLIDLHSLYVFGFAFLLTGGLLGADYIIRRKIIPSVEGYVDPVKARDDFLIKTASELSVDAIGNIFTKTVRAIFYTNLAGFLALDKEKREKVFYENLDTIPTKEMLSFFNVFLKWSKQRDDTQYIVLSEIEYTMMGSLDFVRNNELLQIMSFMRKYSIEVVFLIDKKVNITGMTFVGKKGGDKNYSVEDIDLLKVIVSSASVAMSRAILYREVKSFAQVLEKKVDLATKELKEKVVALEEARRLERDMVDIIGHELRTPISIVKGSFLYLMSIIDKHLSLSDFNDEREKILEYEDRINENIDREIKLLETLLSSTKIDKGVLELKKEKVDIIDVIEDGIVGQEKHAEDKGLYLKFEKPEDEKSYPRVFADRARIQEVVDNLLSNAVKYTETGGVNVNMEHDDEVVTVHVHDTGIGIPEEEIDNLGKKFYRIQQYTEGSETRDLKMVRAGGTGLGLYVTFGIVQRHGGKIWVTSEKGKGSTFHFTVPIYKNQLEDKSQNEEEVADVFKRLGLK